MTFCAGCGSPNLDTDATCRVCGRSLTGDPTPQPASTALSTDQVSASLESAPTPTATALADAPSGWPSRTGAPPEPDLPSTAPVASLPPTGVATPSGFESVPPVRHEPAGRAANDIPSFMRPAARAASAPPPNESASLISEHDLPDWIRQIAADDARKLADAQVQEAAAVVATSSSMPSHFGRRAMPGETLSSGPASSSWLSRKDAVAGAAESAWDVTGAAPPSRPVMFPDAMPAQTTAPSDALPIATDVVVAETVTAPSRRRRRGTSEERAVETPKDARPARIEGASRGNPRQVYLVAAIVVAILIMVAMAIL